MSVVKSVLDAAATRASGHVTAVVTSRLARVDFAAGAVLVLAGESAGFTRDRDMPALPITATVCVPVSLAGGLASFHAACEAARETAIGKFQAVVVAWGNTLAAGAAPSWKSVLRSGEVDFGLSRPDGKTLVAYASATYDFRVVLAL